MSTSAAVLAHHHQQKFSVWTVVAFAQCSIWFLWIPHVCRPYWYDLFGRRSEEMAEVLLGLTAPIMYFGSILVMLPIYYGQFKFFEQYKVDPEIPWPWSSKVDDPTIRNQFWKLSVRSIKISSFNLLVLVPILVAMKVRLVKMTGLPLTSFSVQDDEWPTSYWTILWQNAAMTVLHEFGFYWMHRLSHEYPSLYKYHKIHHEYKHNTVLAAQHNHPIDYILSIGGPALLATAIVRPHSIILFQWFLWTLAANMDDHLGYTFPWSPVRWFPFSASTEEHEYHHSHNKGCFGSKLSIYNTWFGGYDSYLTYVTKSSAKTK